MSKMPAYSRSLHSVWLKTSRNLPACGVADKAWNSATAMRTRCTPSPVPVRIQSSCAAARVPARAAIITASRIHVLVRNFGNISWNDILLRNSLLPMCKIELLAHSAPIIKPEFHRNPATGILPGQGTKSINALERSDRGGIQRGNSARLAHLNVCRLPRAGNLESDVDPVCLVNVRVHFVLKPVFGNLAAHVVHIPGEASSKVATS